MKKLCVLLLCVALLLALPTGCKKNRDNQPGELTDSIISSDLIRNDHLYSYAHCGQVDAVSGLKIVNKTVNGDKASASVTAQAISSYTTFDLAANVDYTFENGRWTLKDIQITKSVPTPTNGLDQESALLEISNYVSVVGKALGVQGDVEQWLPTFNLRGGNWNLQWEKGSTTAKLAVNYKSEALTFKGYYALNFSETGWHFETKEVDGTHHIVLHLESLNLKINPEP